MIAMTQAPVIGPRTRFATIFGLPLLAPTFVVDVDRSAEFSWINRAPLCKCGDEDCRPRKFCLREF